MNKQIYKKVAMVIWFLALSVAFVTGTTLSDTVSSFTGIMTITPSDASTGLTINQDYAQVALDIDSEATTHATITTNTNAGAAIMKLGDPISPAGTYDFNRNIASGDSTGPVVEIDQSNAGDDQETLSILNAGTGNGAFIDQNGEGKGLYIDSEALTNPNLHVEGIYTGASNTGMAHIRNNGIQTLGDVLRVQQDHSSASSNAQTIQNDGTGDGLFIDQNGNGRGLEIDTEATTLSGFILLQDGIFTGTTTTSAHVIRLNNAASTGTASFIQNAGTGTGLIIDQNGDGKATEIFSSATSSSNYALDVSTGAGANVARFVNDATNTVYLGLNSDNSIGSNWFYRNDVLGNTNAPTVLIEQDNVGDDQNTLDLQQDGTGMQLALTGTDNVVCDAAESGIIANSTGIFACFGGTATELAS